MREREREKRQRNRDKLSNVLFLTIMEPQVEYICPEPRVKNRPDLQIAICGKSKCYGISVFRKCFFDKFFYLGTLVFTGLLPNSFESYVCDLALYATAFACEREGYRISFRKYRPMLMKFQCEYCDREEMNTITPECEVLECKVQDLTI